MQTIISILTQERELLKSLLDTAVQKQTALVSSDRNKLDECTRNEEGLLPRVNSIEIDRLREFNNIRAKFNIKITSNKLDAFLEIISESIPENDVKTLTELQSSIKTIVEDLTKLNQQNMYLINSSKKFISDTINALISKNEKSILDRKV